MQYVSKKDVTSLIDKFGSWKAAKPHIINRYRDLENRVPTTEEVYNLVHDLTDIDTIAPCGKKKRLDGFYGGYRFCGNIDACECASKNFQEKSGETFLRKYGTKRPLQNAEVLERMRQTNLIKRGTDWALSCPEVKKKIKHTVRERYGADNARTNTDVDDKIRQTCLDRYGVEHVFQDEGFREKSKKTNLERYGTPHPMGNQAVREKVKQALKDNDWKEAAAKSRVTIMDRYGVHHSSQIRFGEESLNILEDPAMLSEVVNRMSAANAAHNLSVSPTTVYRYWRNHDLPPLRNDSSLERSMAVFLDSLGVTYERNSRTISPMEIDFYLPHFNVAIEMNGIYWHSEYFRDQKYHKTKLAACCEKGIRLIMINEDEWCFRADAIKAYIRHILKMSQVGASARKLILRQVSKGEANSFIDAHHIQGMTANITHAMMAFHDGSPAGVLTFGKQRGSDQRELTRFCVDGLARAGIFSRLFSNSVKEFDFTDVITFADLRYSEGDVYRTNGFLEIGEIAPDYRYVVNGKTYHKSHFTKKKIAQKFGMDMSNRSEREAMAELRYPRIYDCGKLKFRWTK